MSKVQETIDNQKPVSGVANRYADAIYELAESKKKIDEVEKDMNNIKKAMEESKELRDLVKSPVFSMEDKLGAFEKIMKKIKVNDLCNRFIQVVIANKRSKVIDDIINAFNAKLANVRGETIAYISSAREMTKEQIEKLQKTLKSIIGKDVKLIISNDDSLQGGMIVKIGSKQIDTSIKTKLDALRLTLKEVG